MNDAERWINLQGPPPPGIREMLEAAREPWMPAPWTPELEEELDRNLRSAIAVEDAKWARERRLKRMKVGLAVGAFTFTLAAAAALVLWVRASAPAATLVRAVADAPALLRAPADLAGAVAPALSPAPPPSASSRPADTRPPSPQ